MDRKWTPKVVQKGGPGAVPKPTFSALEALLGPNGTKSPPKDPPLGLSAFCLPFFAPQDPQNQDFWSILGGFLIIFWLIFLLFLDNVMAEGGNKDT